MRCAATAGIDGIAVGLRFAHGFGRKLARQIEARDGRLAGELDRLLGIEKLRDARLRIRALARVTRDGRDHPVAVLRAIEIAVRNHAAHADAPVRGGDERVAAVHFHRADESLGGVFEDLLELAGIAPVATALDGHAHPVAVHHAGHLRRRQEHGIFLALDPHETEARAIGAHDAFGGVRHRGAATGGLARRLLSIVSLARAGRASLA